MWRVSPSWTGATALAVVVPDYPGELHTGILCTALWQRMSDGRKGGGSMCTHRLLLIPIRVLALHGTSGYSTIHAATARSDRRKVRVGDLDVESGVLGQLPIHRT